MQYLIKTITHDTGEVFHDVVKARENEVLHVIEVDNNTLKEVLDKTKEHIKEHGYTINIDMN
jgi:arginase family enzyme